MTEPRTWDELKQDPRVQRGRRIGMYVMLGVVAAVLGAAGISALGGDDAPGSDFGPAEARVMCEGFVRDRLTSPSTGSFERPTVAEEGAGQFRVTGRFDAENSFGGTVPGSYSCTVRGADGEATLVDLDITER